MRRDPPNGRVQFLATVIQKIAWLEHRIADVGDPRGYIAREVAALTWCVEQLRDLDPAIAALIPQAEVIAEQRLTRVLAARTERG